MDDDGKEVEVVVEVEKDWELNDDFVLVADKEADDEIQEEDEEAMEDFTDEEDMPDLIDDGEELPTDQPSGAKKEKKLRIIDPDEEAFINSFKYARRMMILFICLSDRISFPPSLY